MARPEQLTPKGDWRVWLVLAGRGWLVLAGRGWLVLAGRGWGNTRTVRAGMRITPAQAEQLLGEDLGIAERAVARLVRVPLSDNQFAALVSFVFNVGAANFERSTLLRLLNRGWYDQVPAQLMRWNRARGEVLGGLNRRRAAEARLWNAPDRPETAPSIPVSAGGEI